MRSKSDIDDVVRRRTRRRDPREERDSLPPEEPHRPSNRPDPREEPASLPPGEVRSPSHHPDPRDEPGWDAAQAAAGLKVREPVEERAKSASADELLAPLRESARPPRDVLAESIVGASERPLAPSLPPTGLSSIPAPPRAPTNLSADPRLIELEPLLARGDWKAVADRLGPPEKAGELPPTLGLIYALAQREAFGDTSATPANILAIQCMAALYGVSHESATALVLAKRLLRQNPSAWRSAPAPSARVSVPLILLAIVLGCAAGWYLTLGSLHFF